MGLFDRKKNTAAQAEESFSNADKNKTVEVVFPALPDNFEQFKALEQAALSNPFDVAALTVLALCFYPQDRDASLAMLDFLRGPRPLSTYDKQFIRDRFMDKDYVPRSYFNGATPQNPIKTRAMQSCMSPPAAPTVRVRSRFAWQRTESGICGSSTFWQESARPRAAIPGHKPQERRNNKQCL